MLCQHMTGLCYVFAHDAAEIHIYRLVVEELQLLLLGHTALATAHQPTYQVHPCLMVRTCLAACEQR